MPRIFDNIDAQLLDALLCSLESAHRADFCVGYFNLRGWKPLAGAIEQWPGGEGKQVRLLVGMPVDEDQELRRRYSLLPQDEMVDQATVLRVKAQMARKFRDQLTRGFPTDSDQAGLKTLARQLRSKRLAVKLHTRYPLHGKLYLTHREDFNNPRTAFLGSSNLTFSGLKGQGELNVDVQDHDAALKLDKWFEARWDDRYSLDISEDLAAIIDESWVTERTPYHIYIKLAYELSREARSGVSQFAIPAAFRGRLFQYQEQAVKIAAHHLVKRGGVLLGDVVGLGKTIMAACVARLYIEDHGAIPLILCPPRLKTMWERYSNEFDLYARVLSFGKVHHLAGEFSRHKLVIIDESHNLRNRESQTYRAVKNYIDEMSARVILLSATPYNKGYQDISSQLRLFLDENENLGIRPEVYLRSFPNGEAEFSAKHQCPVNCIRAFEHSPAKEDWQQLLKMFMVRRVRSFIKNHYAEADPTNGRKYLVVSDGDRAYFPDRIPHTEKFEFDESDTTDPYALLFNRDVVEKINHLHLARYGLANYLRDDAGERASEKERKIIDNLGRAGNRLMGFCRTNLFKRLESCGEAFLLSIDRHILRNHLFLFAIENGLPLPIGTQDPAMLDTANDDSDDERLGLDDDRTTAEDVPTETAERTDTAPEEADYRRRAETLYRYLEEAQRHRFEWLGCGYFDGSLAAALKEDADQLRDIFRRVPKWPADQDRKLDALVRLLRDKHPNEKVLVFTQFADTALYLSEQLERSGIDRLAVVTGGDPRVEDVARHFSPVSNGLPNMPPEQQLRVVVTTDVLSEGQNLQDAHVVVNFDLPWAIIRLVQRAGRVDRIGQQHPTIDCYSFMPMKGVEDIIRLRARVRQRLKENLEVVGSDENYFDDDGTDGALVDLYTEKAGILDGSEDESEVDLQSRAYQIYAEAIRNDPSLERTIQELPDVVYSGKDRDSNERGVLVYVRTPEDTDSLAYLDPEGRSLTEDQGAILDIARCEPDTPARPVVPHHHELVEKGVRHLLDRSRGVGGSLGRPNGARYRTYMALKRFIEANRGSLLVQDEHEKALELLYHRPLRDPAVTALNAALRRGASDEEIATLTARLYEERRLCHDENDDALADPRVICSLSLG